MSQTSDKIARRVFLLCLLLAIFGAGFLYGALAMRKDLFPGPQVELAYDTLSTLGNNDLTSHPRRHHLQPSLGRGAGVVRNEIGDDGALVFMAGFFDDENQARLVRRDGSVMRKWTLDYFGTFPDAGTRVCDLASTLHVDQHGALMTSRGEVVFNYEYCGTVKLSPCGEVLWTLNERTHHSIVPAAAGGYWLLNRQRWVAADAPERMPPFSSSATGQEIKEDTILRITEDGEILKEVSIPRLLRDGHLEALLTANGEDFSRHSADRDELVHSNKVAELPAAYASAYPLFEAGDLVLSMRDLNLVVVVDPDNWDVKWHQTGPWIRQHDPEFRPDGRISVFNNNMYRTVYPDEVLEPDAPRVTNITAVEPVSGETEVLFGETPGQEMLSAIRGQHEILPEGGMVIAEFDGGRVLQTNAAGDVVWEYVNAFDDSHVGEITDAKIYPSDYFETAWEPCPAP
ncbi:arylsulfotransferase family protein [Alloyangia pacifica]|uniref:arylsulfotransferase family protein n=1 Tax=Alloyangia pacifica TaxID=311180 RepID=UPI001CFCF543|nr:arylsulfotransferase family protein [Alloyangia pacifica]